MKTKSVHKVFFVGIAVLTMFLNGETAQAASICCHWPSYSVPYDTTYLPAGYVSAVDFGAGQWTASSSSTFSYNNTSSNHTMDDAYIDGAGGVLAITFRSHTVPAFEIIDADISFDQDENWYTGSGAPGGAQQDLRSAATHEFGHALGLNHTDPVFCSGGAGAVTSATMCDGQVTGTSNKRSLESDDHNGLGAIYP